MNGLYHTPIKWLDDLIPLRYHAPMQYVATTKVTGGKLLRVKCDVESGASGNVLSAVSITGDFFMHPEDGVVQLEGALLGADRDAPIGEYVSRLNDVIVPGGFELIGFSASDVAQTLWNALHPEASVV